MGLWCSLLGHTFDETDVEEEREDRGSEVVTVIRELERCSRCDAERIVSENKEVTSVVDSEAAGVESDVAGSDAGSGGNLGGGVDRETAFGEGSFDTASDPAEEDAEILTDDSENREPGEWPDGDEPRNAGEAVGEAGDPEPLDDVTDAKRGGDILDAEAEGLDDGLDPTESSKTVPEGTYECPECAFTVDADSSFRAGDACPECQQGYLEERNR